MIPRKTLTLKNTSEILDVSTATVRNWIRCGYLSPVVRDKKRVFLYNEIINLRKKIGSGKIDRLRRRANKRKSQSVFLPQEYLGSTELIESTNRVTEIIFSNGLDKERALFVIAMKLLSLKTQVVCVEPSRPDSEDSYDRWKRGCVKKEMLSWARSISRTDDKNYAPVYNSLGPIDHDDILGVIYQCLLAEGDKSEKGSYYTPVKIVDGIMNSHLTDDSFVLDPCCGTGGFLLRAAKTGHREPSKLFGFDIDPIAVRIARVNVLMAFPEKDFSPNIAEGNPLSGTGDDKLTDRFDVVATNPPWGALIKGKPAEALKDSFPEITSQETFSYFLAKSLRLVKDEGIVSFILPVSILNIKAHRDIRKLILKDTTILAVHCLGKIFKGVFTDVVRIDLKKHRAPAGWKVQIAAENRRYEVKQHRFWENEDHIFDIFITAREHEILKHIFSVPHRTLKDSCQWALGIVTGNNRKYISSTPKDRTEPVYKGSDIKPFVLSSPGHFIKFAPELFQQVAPIAKYRADEKLVYKFISNKPVFAYDNSQSLTLNSANILIPEIRDYPLKAILALTP